MITQREKKDFVLAVFLLLAFLGICVFASRLDSETTPEKLSAAAGKVGAVWIVRCGEGECWGVWWKSDESHDLPNTAAGHDYRGQDFEAVAGPMLQDLKAELLREKTGATKINDSPITSGSIWTLPGENIVTSGSGTIATADPKKICQTGCECTYYAKTGDYRTRCKGK